MASSNTSAIIGGLVIVAAVAGLGYYIYTKRTAPPAASTTANNSFGSNTAGATQTENQSSLGTVGNPVQSGEAETSTASGSTNFGSGDSVLTDTTDDD